MRKLLVLCLGLVSSVFAQKFEGLALTPPMGWNTWNTFASNIDEFMVKETAEAMIKNGMRDAGYVYIVLDDTWSAMTRDAQGNLVAHPEKFPRRWVTGCMRVASSLASMGAPAARLAVATPAAGGMSIRMP